MSFDLVSIILASFNGEKVLPTFLSSLQKTTYKKYEVIICDDGSTDKSIQIIKKFMKRDKRIQLKINSTNLGAAATRNVGACVAKGKYLVFLDNDIELDPKWLTELLCEAKPANVGAVLGKIRDYQKRGYLQAMGVKLWPSTGWGLGQGMGQLDSGQFDKSEFTTTLSGFLLVKKNVFDLVRGFDSVEARYTEDIDLGWRIWIAGFAVVTAHRAVMYHGTNMSATRTILKSDPSKIYFALARNSFRSMIKNYELKNLMIYLPQSLIINLIRAMLVIIRRKDFSAWNGFWQAIVWQITNLSETISTRAYVQSTRKTSDQELFRKLFIRDSIWQIYKLYFSGSDLI